MIEAPKESQVARADPLFLGRDGDFYLEASSQAEHPRIQMMS